MKKYQHYIDVRGEVLPTPGGTTTAVATSSNLGKTDPSEIETRQYKKTADSGELMERTEHSGSVGCESRTN